MIGVSFLQPTDFPSIDQSMSMSITFIKAPHSALCWSFESSGFCKVLSSPTNPNSAHSWLWLSCTKIHTYFTNQCAALPDAQAPAGAASKPPSSREVQKQTYFEVPLGTNKRLVAHLSLSMALNAKLGIDSSGTPGKTRIALLGMSGAGKPS